MMQKKIELELFRFDVNTDYLPYYAKIHVKIDEELRLCDLLDNVKESIPEYGYDAYGFKINQVVVYDFNLEIKSLCKRFGYLWKIEPLNPHLVLKDLIINPESFLQKIENLRAYGLQANKDFILSFLPYAYATPISVKNLDYFTEAFFIIAASLYQENKNDDLLTFAFDKGLFNVQNLETYFYPQDGKVDEYIYEFKKATLEKCVQAKRLMGVL